MRSPARTLCRWAATIAAAGFLALGASSLPAFAYCAPEVTVGGEISQDRLSSGGQNIDLSQTGAMVGIGGECMFRLRQPRVGEMLVPMIGVGGRYSWMHATSDIATQSLTSDELWEVWGKFGLMWHDKFMPYVAAGWSGETLGLPFAMGTKNPTGAFVAGGVEGHITGAWWWKGEVSDHLFNDLTLDTTTKITPNPVAARLGLTYHFGGDGVPLASASLK